MRFGWYVLLGTSEPPHLSLGPPREDQRATRCYSTKMATNSPRVPALSHGHSELYAALRAPSMFPESIRAYARKYRWASGNRSAGGYDTISPSIATSRVSGSTSTFGLLEL